MRTIRVALADRSYSVLIEEGILAQIGTRCHKTGLGKSCAVISDAQVAPLYAPATEKALAKAGFKPLLITIPSGEKAKSLAVAAKCYDQLAAARLDRQSFVVALGGGVVG